MLFVRAIIVMLQTPRKIKALSRKITHLLARSKAKTPKPHGPKAIKETKEKVGHADVTRTSIPCHIFEPSSTKTLCV